MKDERQALIRTQPEQCRVEIGASFGLVALLPFHVREPDHRPPTRPLCHAALVGHDRQEPRPKGSHVPAQLAQLAPSLDRRLLDGVLGRGPVVEHDGRQPVGRVEQGLDQH